MKKEEIIKLNEVEYTLTLNRESFLKIDQYSNIEKSMNTIQEDLYEHIEEIEDGIDPFAEELNDDIIEQKTQEKLDTLHKIIERAFWIWLYPQHKLNISEVKEILKDYFDDEEKFQFICDKYAEYMEKCVEIRANALEIEKNLKAQVNKK